MPDPLLYSEALAASLVASAALVFAARKFLSPRLPVVAAVVQVLSMVAAASVGWAILNVRPAMPASNALDRLLTIVFPAAVAGELLRLASRIPHVVQLVVRGGIAAVAPFVLLYGSVYLRPSRPEWSGGLIVVWLTLIGFGLAITWWWTTRTAQRRRSDQAVPLGFALATFAAGILIMLAGYLKGGAAALPLAVATLGAGCWPDSAAKLSARPSITGLAVVGWFGMLIVGSYFGQLSNGSILAVILAPLLALVPDSWIAFCRAEWQRTAVRLALVAVPLVIALVPAVFEFQRKMGPLLAAECGRLSVAEPCA